jgi:single-strand DNA-binding protein
VVSFNKVILVGNLTRDPELRSTPNGTSICRFSLAVSRQFRNADGSTRDEVLFVEVDSFGKQAETIGRHMAKGRPLLVEGRLRLDQWESQNGEKRSRIMVVMESFQFLTAPTRQELGDEGGGESTFNRGDGPAAPQRRPQQQQQRGGPSKAKSREPEDGNDGGDDDEEIPF